MNNSGGNSAELSFFFIEYAAEHKASPSLGEVASRISEITERFFLERLTAFISLREVFKAPIGASHFQTPTVPAHPPWEGALCSQLLLFN